VESGVVDVDGSVARQSFGLDEVSSPHFRHCCSAGATETEDFTELNVITLPGSSPCSARVSSRGLPAASAGQAPLAHSFSQVVVPSGEPLLIADVRAHPLVWDDPALADLGAIAYAGIPLVTPEGDVLGCVSVIDDQPRAWTDQEVALLRDVAATAMMALELCVSRHRWSSASAGSGAPWPSTLPISSSSSTPTGPTATSAPRMSAFWASRPRR
jgi:GAF domain-containing protein